MTPRWAPDTLVFTVSRAVNLWKPHVYGPAASLQFYPSHNSHHRLHVQQSTIQRFEFLSWKRLSHQRSRARKACLCRSGMFGLHPGTLCLNASASRRSADLSRHMSRIRSTLDTVSKAVSGTHTELLSKIARLKPHASQASKEVKERDATPKAEKSATTPASAPPQIDSLSSETTPTLVSVETSNTPTPTPKLSAKSDTTSVPSHNIIQATVPTAVSNEPDLKEKRLRDVAASVKTISSTKRLEQTELPPYSEAKRTTISKSNPPLFHPSTLSVSLDETYNYLSHHINTYFNSKTRERKADGGASSCASLKGQQSNNLTPGCDNKAFEPTDASAPSIQKKGLGHYLSYSGDTVQAFVGSYIAPLVPKFRAADSKSAPVKAKQAEDAPVKKTESAAVSVEQKAADEKAKRLLLQREKIIARLSVDNRTRALVQALHKSTDVRIYINRVEDLSYHLLEFPETRGVAVKEKVIPRLLRLRQANDPGLKAAVRESLSLVGYHDPVKGQGIRVLSIDGGGLRGLLALQTLHKLETLTGKPIYQLFDYICGVSTGAILGFMLGLFQIPLSECDDLYRKLGSDVFKQNVIVGTVKMGWSHAFYDSEPWEKILKEKIGCDLMVETSRNPNCPKVSAVSTIVNRGTPLKAYVFRNYNLLPGVRSHYLGGCQHQLWQALRASSAAPGYFQEFALGSDLHQDGGLLVNNPTALAIHECKCLWPDTPIDCVVSLGTGRFETPGKHSGTYTSLKTKLTNVISSATDTEEVHTMLDALLPPDTYFRFNPYMSEEITLDESRLEKLNLLESEAVRYLERNEEKMRKAARILTREKSSVRRATDWARLRADMYSGPPSFLSKL